MPLEWAKWLIERRRIEARQTAEGYETVLALGLLMFRRRPKPGYSVSQIVRAAQALWVGGMHRAFLDPELYPEYERGASGLKVSISTGLPEGNGQIERAMVDLILGMTEESLFAINHVDSESQVIAEALRRYQTAERMVTLESVSTVVGIEVTLLRVRGQISVPAFGHEKSPPLGADVQFLASVDRPPF